MPVTASTSEVYAVALPPWASTTLASKTGRTVPFASATERSRDSWSWAKPATLNRVQPSLVVTSVILVLLTARPTLAAAFCQAPVAESVAPGTEVAVERASEEETYWIAPSPTPTVTMLSIAGAGPPKSWRKSTARASLPARGWLLTRSRPPIWAGVRPNRSAWEPSQARAAVTALLEEAVPRLPSGFEMLAGVPNRFQRTRPPSDDAALFCAAVGSSLPRRSRSSRPASASSSTCGTAPDARGVQETR